MCLMCRCGFCVARASCRSCRERTRLRLTERSLSKQSSKTCKLCAISTLSDSQCASPQQHVLLRHLQLKCHREICRRLSMHDDVHNRLAGELENQTRTAVGDRCCCKDQSGTQTKRQGCPTYP
eukprot:353445-Chlamydomonas_euryale.AAC.4